MTSAPGRAEADRPFLTSVRHAGRRLLRKAKYFTGDRPALLPIHVRLTPEGSSRVITDATNIVIEGFPRSGNTFAVFAFRHAQDDDVTVASHIHHLAPLKIAIARSLPLLVVVRPPVDCLASYLVAGPHARPAGVLAEYLHHHRGVEALSDHLVLATFEQVTTDFPSVVNRVNARFSTDFNPFEHTPEAEEQVFAAISEYHAAVHTRKEASRVVPRPDANRRDEAESWRELLLDPALATARSEAEALFQRLAKLAN